MSVFPPGKTQFFYLLLLILLPLLLLTCQSLQELYEDGDYNKAYKAALWQLNKKPQDEQALSILEQSLNQLVTAKQIEFTRLRKTGDPDTWEKALDVVAEMDALIEQTQPYLNEPFAEEQAIWWADALALEEQLYIHYVDRGKERLEQSLANDDAQLGQWAYADFSRAIHYQQPDFPEKEELANYQEEAKEAGTIYYTVSIDDGFNIGLFGLDIDGAFGNLERRGNRFLVIKQGFISNSGDCAIDIDFGEFETSVREKEDRDRFSESIITDYETHTDTSGNVTETPIYSEVEGWVETVTSIKTAEWEVSVDVNRRTKNCSIFGESYTQQLTSEVEYYRTGGDERAIPDKYKRNSCRDEHPDDDDMAEELLEELVGLICGDYF